MNISRSGRLLRDTWEQETKLQKPEGKWGDACGGTAWSSMLEGNVGSNVKIMLLSKVRDSPNDSDVGVL